MRDYRVTVESLFDEIYVLAEEQGAQTQEIWNDLVEEVIQSHVDVEEFAPSDEIDKFRIDLKSRFDEYAQDKYERTHTLDEELLDVGQDNN
jgi:hypothetical protein